MELNYNKAFKSSLEMKQFAGGGAHARLGFPRRPLSPTRLLCRSAILLGSLQATESLDCELRRTAAAFSGFFQFLIFSSGSERHNLVPDSGRQFHVVSLLPRVVVRRGSAAVREALSAGGKESFEVTRAATCRQMSVFLQAPGDRLSQKGYSYSSS